MELNEYQERAMLTCMATSKNFSYMFTNLAGEVGEFASKVAKAIRKGKAEIRDNHLYIYNVPGVSVEEGYAFERELKKEAGDILWQLSGLCTMMGWCLDDVAEMNLEKLLARAKAGTIDGNGDGVTKEERQ